MTPRAGAGERVRRVLAELLWIAERDGPTWTDAAEQFGIGVDVLRADMDLASMIGGDSDDFLDMPVEMWSEGERVFVTLHGFDRPLRLTPDEALVLLVSARAATVGDRDGLPDALARALEKIGRMLDLDPAVGLDVDLGIVDRTVFEVLRAAVDEHRAVEIEHLRVADDVRTRRVVEPWTIFREGGAWYLSGHCRRAGAERVFRVDRIVAADVLDEVVAPPTEPPPAAALRADVDAARLVLDLDAEGRWVADSYPTEAVESRPDGVLRVTLVVTSVSWAERLLLRLGVHATIVRADAPLPADLPRTAARAVLARYRADRGSAGVTNGV